MSGIEIAGLALGAFPLLISAMEHYEDTKKVTKMWWAIRRAHRKDVGKIKDGQLKFRLNLKELLLPLVVDAVVEDSEYEKLLADPGGAGWKEVHVEDALRERLSDCYERYFEILQNLLDVLARLSRECRVDDVNFQAVLKKRQETLGNTNNQQAQTTLMVRANITFGAKRVAYAFTSGKREDLIREIDQCNSRLQDILAYIDRVSTLMQRNRPLGTRRVAAKTLRFWKHAEGIWRILDRIWHCNCRSTATLWLNQQTNMASLKMHLPLCHGRHLLEVKQTESPPVLQLHVPVPRKPKTSLLSAQPGGAGTTSLVSSFLQRLRADKPYRPSSTASVMFPVVGMSSPLHTVSPDLEADGICKILSKSPPLATTIGALIEDDHEYAVVPSAETLTSTSAQSLAHLLRPGSTIKLTRVRRSAIALTLASSHLKLHSSQWLQKYWTLDDVHLSTHHDAAGKVVFHTEPHILLDLGPTAQPRMAIKDRSFLTLGIVLLELCFAARLEEHQLWLRPTYAPMQADPLFRQTVANEWLDDVQEEAGEDYANAVSWTLKQAPADSTGEKWRSDFAQHVVQPLQRYHEYLSSKKT